MADIQTVTIDSIDHNPFRNTGNYPFVERKLEALKRSIADVGLWEGVIARQNGNRYELAFGHHRTEAARQGGLTEIPVIVRDLTDEQMLGFMGRENMEDYNADFLVMLETWEAAWQWEVTTRDVISPQPIEVARLLGWGAPRTGGGEMMNRTADACNAAHSLLRDGHLERDDLAELTVNEAREICTRAAANISRINKAGKALGTPREHIAAAEKAVAKSVKTTARQSRSGEVAQKDLRGRVDLNAYKHANTSKVRQSPLFEVFGKALAEGIRRMLNGDATAEKLGEVAKALGQIKDESDRIVVRRVVYELGELSDRAGSYKRRLSGGARVIPLSISGRE